MVAKPDKLSEKCEYKDDLRTASGWWSSGESSVIHWTCAYQDATRYKRCSIKEDTTKREETNLELPCAGAVECSSVEIPKQNDKYSNQEPWQNNRNQNDGAQY